MKSIKYLVASLAAGTMMTFGGVLTSCSDLDIPDAGDLNKVGNLAHSVKNRSVTLTWTLPQGATKAIILQNGVKIAEVEGTTYTVEKVEAGTTQAFTVKAVYDDGTVSEGLTIYVTVTFSGPKSAYLVLGNLETLDDDEQASYGWFKRQYVDTEMGEFIAMDETSKLDPEIYGCLMIHVDRVGLGKGADKLPVSAEALADIAAYGQKGGNLFLSNHATQLVAALGRIDTKYDVNIFGDGNGGENPDTWNLCPYLGYACNPVYDYTGHPLYQGISLSQVSDWAPGISLASAGFKEDHNSCWDLNAYGFNLVKYGNTVNAFQKINKCSVIGTWSHVKDYAVAAAIDFKPTASWAGRIVAVGTNCNEWHQPENAYQANIEKLAANALNYMAEKPEYVPETDDAYMGYVVIDDFENLDDDEQASYNWFKKNYVDTGKGAFIDSRTVNGISAEDFNAIMLHVDRVGLTNGIEKLPGRMGTEEFVNMIKSYVTAGGNLFLSNHACQYVEAIGRIPENCKIAGFGAGDGGPGSDYWSACPYQGYGEDGTGEYCDDHTGHPLFKGLELTPELVTDYNFPPGYALIGMEWREDHNCIWDVNAMGYQGGANNIRNFQEDQACECLATWSHVRDWCVSGMTDFHAKGEYKGRIVAIGLAAYEWHQNVGVNPFHSNIEKIAENALSYLSE